MKTLGWNQPGNVPQVCAYTFQAGGKSVGFDISKSRLVGCLIQLDPGDVAGAIFGAQQDTQGAAAGTQVQYLCLPGQPDKTGKRHGVGAEGKGTLGVFQSKSVMKKFHGNLRNKKSACAPETARRLMRNRRISLPRLLRQGSCQRRCRS